MNSFPDPAPPDEPTPARLMELYPPGKPGHRPGGERAPGVRGHRPAQRRTSAVPVASQPRAVPAGAGGRAGPVRPHRFEREGVDVIQLPAVRVVITDAPRGNRSSRGWTPGAAPGWSWWSRRSNAGGSRGGVTMTCCC
ncbi:hypothetical protein V2I01_11020 [Micromonospora sp. BRA006-A]|nr:hypothetical protein [Micromonospora sp. BRA006-A]